MRKILITGGAGFVGRHFCKRLLDQGDEVHCVDSVVDLTGGIDPEAGWPLFEPRDYDNFHFHHEDCRTYFERVGDTDFDLVMPLAAMVGGRMMIEHNPLAVADDLAIDALFWQWAVRTKPGRTCYFSSSAAYPISLQTRDNYQLLTEECIEFQGDIGMPDLTYGWAKLTGEYLARLAFEKHGLKCVSYRPFSGYGEDQDDHYPFPAICKRVIKEQGASQIQVWGTGEQMRDFIHIEDCVTGVLTTMGKIDNGHAINLSTGILTNFKDMVRMAAKELGYEPEVIGTSTRPEGVFARGGDTQKQQSLGFEATTDFQAGLKNALAYFQKLEG
jgi:nucleoside-diphosphate-sugar epimerase